MEREPHVRMEWIDVAALAIIVMLVAFVALGTEGPVRALLALAFVTFVPGWAIVTNWTAAARTSLIALSVLLSLAITVAAATIALWLDRWHPIGLFYAAAAACALAITWSLVRRRKRVAPQS